MLRPADRSNEVRAKAAGRGLMDKQDAYTELYVTARGLDGVYLMLGEEERKIRQNPIATGSVVLTKVWGSIR